MTPDLVTIRCRKDNYAYLLHTDAGTVLFDAPEAGPILAALKDHGWRLDQIALTHHHDDHVSAVPELVAATGATVIGAARDAHRLPPLDQALAPGDTVTLAGMDAEVIDAAGHTTGHIAFYLPQAAMAFTADSLMAIGCGRLFECDPAVMWATLQRLAALPDDTLICSGHDYCAANGAFALTVDGDNAALKARLRGIEGGSPCTPVTLAEEKATNPFLRAGALAASLRLEGAAEGAVFARLRSMKDAF